MSDHEFLFALELSDEKTFDGMLAELAQAVLVYVGLGRPAIDELSRALRGALVQRRAELAGERVDRRRLVADVPQDAAGQFGEHAVERRTTGQVEGEEKLLIGHNRWILQ